MENNQQPTTNTNPAPRKRGRPRKNPATTPKKQVHPAREATPDAVVRNLINRVNELEREVHSVNEQNNALMARLRAAFAIIEYLENKVGIRGA